jgi:UDP-N-acetylmuramoyl-L-alanyl-D-glutamate--2,6-diaminopimelate ligase
MSAVARTWRPLKAVLGGLVDVPESLEVSDLAIDSRHVTPGAAFFACRGGTRHGLDFAAAAAAAGARAVLWEPAPGVQPPTLGPEVVVRPVPNLRAQLGYIADRFFDAPSATLTVAGITGTNGKTTCAWLLAQALEQIGRRAAYIGTLGGGRIESLRELAVTTPDAIALHRLFAQVRAEGCEAVAMEVSSHALDQDRCAGVRFHTAVFTNLTRDHLDYHGDMAAYGVAKAKLFAWPTLRARVINVDDAFGRELALQAQRGGGSARLFLTSRDPAAIGSGNTDYLWARSVERLPGGIALDIASSRGDMHLSSRLIGDFNVDNLLTVLAVLLSWDTPPESACAALERCPAPPGRMQSEGGDGRPLVLIDYAHTPDALAKALAAARVHCRGTLHCVFGAGGDRDPGKRSEMGRIAARGADHLVITNDNPRTEDPQRIIDAILDGVRDAGMLSQTSVNPDRAAAIRAAVANAGPEDVVLVAGKGHEDYQILGTQRRHFSDADEARAALRDWRGR